MASDTTPATAAKPKREAASEKLYLDSAGKTVEIDDVSADVFSYKDLGDGSTYTVAWTSLDPAVQKMFGLFGMSTLATNVASFNRNQAKAEEQFASDAEAVKARFGRMEPGNWGIKSPSGRMLIDVDVLIEVISGLDMAPPDEVAFKAALVADSTLRGELRDNEQIAPLYDEKIRAKKAAAAPAKSSLADIMAKFKPAPTKPAE